MTGRDIVLYILENGLEDDPVVRNGKLIGFLTIEEAAQKMGVGTATILTLMRLGNLEGVEIGNVTFIPANFESILEKKRSKLNE